MIIMFSNGENQAENKLLLLYLLLEVEGKAYQRQTVDFILDHEMMDYFTVQHLISELKKAGLIEVSSAEEGIKMLNLTAEGKNTLMYFKNRIPDKKLRNFHNLVHERKQALQKNIKILSRMQKLQDGAYLVKLGISKNGTEDLYLKLHASNLEEAETIINRWKKDYQKISSELYSLLLND